MAGVVVSASVLFLCHRLSYMCFLFLIMNLTFCFKAGIKAAGKIWKVFLYFVRIFSDYCNGPPPPPPHPGKLKALNSWKCVNYPQGCEEVLLTPWGIIKLGRDGTNFLKSASRKSANSWAYSLSQIRKLFLRCTRAQFANPQFFSDKSGNRKSTNFYSPEIRILKWLFYKVKI